MNVMCTVVADDLDNESTLYYPHLLTANAAATAAAASTVQLSIVPSESLHVRLLAYVRRFMIAVDICMSLLVLPDNAPVV